MKMTRDITLSEELTQETFFRAYMNYASLRNKEKASVWLCQIAKNTYFAWYNEQKKKDSLDDLEVASNDVSIEDAFVQKELSKNKNHYCNLNGRAYIYQESKDGKSRQLLV